MKNLILYLAFSLMSVARVAAAGFSGKHHPIQKKHDTSAVQYGTASYYHSKFQGRKTANGEKFDQQQMTAAHNGLPFNTWIRVTNLRNKRSVIVRVNDRLNPKNKRLVDLSRTAASQLGYVGRGLTRVKVEVLGDKVPEEVTMNKQVK
jgi:rare lipoprotein A